MNYILAGKLLYSTEDGRIAHFGEHDAEIVVLSPIPNRILMVLIENQGEIISREDFFVKVWDQHGKTGSANTLKQYIGLIRRILDTHLETSCIITVPGKGYCFSSEVGVTSDTGESGKPQPMDEIASGKKRPFRKLFKDNVRTIIYSSDKKINAASAIFIVIVLVLAAAAGLLTSSYYNENDNFMFTVNDCKIHNLNKVSFYGDSLINRQKASEIIDNNKIKCLPDDKIYFFTNIKPDSISAGAYSILAVCRKRGKTEMQCMTYRVQG
ncbi:helix-turn-helix domain-containing protein [Enterobacter roggenkampii]|nr:helix-turn-helix domain-containing protein [Enterobacter roggenkampii]